MRHGLSYDHLKLDSQRTFNDRRNSYILSGWKTAGTRNLWTVWWIYVHTQTHTQSTPKQLYKYSLSLGGGTVNDFYFYFKCPIFSNISIISTYWLYAKLFLNIWHISGYVLWLQKALTLFKVYMLTWPWHYTDISVLHQYRQRCTH